MLTDKPKTKILVHGGDPSETLRIKSLIEFVDGQTTNPSLIAKNPEIQQLITSGHTLSAEEEKNEYRKIVQSISPLVGDVEFPLRCLRILVPAPRRCLSRAKKCLLGFQMPISSIRVRTRACEPHKCRSKRVFDNKQQLLGARILRAPAASRLNPFMNSWRFCGNHRRHWGYDRIFACVLQHPHHA